MDKRRPDHRADDRGNAATTGTSLPRCPDCNQSGKPLVHEKTCPLGLGVDQVCADDARWFARHPSKTERRRALHWAEIAQLRMVNCLPPWGRIVGHVHVRQLAPGIRHRSFRELIWVIIE